MGGGGGGTGDGEGSRGPRCPPLSEGLLDSGLYVCVRGAGWAMVVALDERLQSSVKDDIKETSGRRSNKAREEMTHDLQCEVQLWLHIK